MVAHGAGIIGAGHGGRGRSVAVGGRGHLVPIGAGAQAGGVHGGGEAAAGVKLGCCLVEVGVVHADTRDDVVF